VLIRYLTEIYGEFQKSIGLAANSTGLYQLALDLKCYGRTLGLQKHYGEFWRHPQTIKVTGGEDGKDLAKIFLNP